MDIDNGTKSEKTEVTPLNLMSVRDAAGSSVSSPTLLSDTRSTVQQNAGTSAPDTGDTGKSAVDRLYDLPAIQRLLRPRPKIQVLGTPGAGSASSAPAPRHTGSLTNRRAAYRRWLQEQTKEDLIEMIVSLGRREEIDENTRTVLRAMAGEISGETLVVQPIPDDLPYMRLPNVRRAGTHETAPAWRIVLMPLESSTLLGLEIDGEITLGRKSDDASPDLDLAAFGAGSKGVSRFHACLRPLSNNLMLIDNDSSNGTFLNQKRLPTQEEHPLADGDIISLGRLSFRVKIMMAPASHGAKTLI